MLSMVCFIILTDNYLNIFFFPTFYLASETFCVDKFFTTYFRYFSQCVNNFIKLRWKGSVRCKQGFQSASDFGKHDYPNLFPRQLAGARSLSPIYSSSVLSPQFPRFLLYNLLFIEYSLGLIKLTRLIIIYPVYEL